MGPCTCTSDLQSTVSAHVIPRLQLDSSSVLTTYSRVLEDIEIYTWAQSKVSAPAEMLAGVFYRKHR